MKVLFWGTPRFALPSLAALEPAGHEVVAVVTRPDRPSGRGRKVGPSPVKEFARSQGWPVLTPETLRDDAFLEAASRARPHISVVVAYGRILSRCLLDLPALGSVNAHASLLPALRGAAPVNWAVVRGHEETGVTVMRMVEEMDAGPVLAQARAPIGLEDTASTVANRLSEMAVPLLVDTLAKLEAGRAREVEQDHRAATYAPKVDRTVARIDWTRDARSVANLIRGMDASPGAWALLSGHPVKLFRPVALNDRDRGTDRDRAADRDRGAVAGGRARAATTIPGQVLPAHNTLDLVVATGDGAVGIGEVQPPGKRRMASSAWLRGRGAGAVDRFE